MRKMLFCSSTLKLSTSMVLSNRRKSSASSLPGISQFPPWHSPPGCSTQGLGGHTALSTLPIQDSGTCQQPGLGQYAIKWAAWGGLEEGETLPGSGSSRSRRPAGSTAAAAARAALPASRRRCGSCARFWPGKKRTKLGWGQKGGQRGQRWGPPRHPPGRPRGISPVGTARLWHRRSNRCRGESGHPAGNLGASRGCAPPMPTTALSTRGCPYKSPGAPHQGRVGRERCWLSSKGWRCHTPG